MNRNTLLVVIAVMFLAGLGALGFIQWGNPPAAGNNATGDKDNAPVMDKPFDDKRFMAVFDSDQNGQVTPQEFTPVYNSDDNPFPMSAGEGKAALDAKTAFDAMDVDDNQVIDSLDLKVVTTLAWRDFREKALSENYRPVYINGKMLALGALRNKVFSTEQGVANRKELPLGGAYFDSKYFDNYSEVTLDTGDTIRGFVTEHDGRHWLLTADKKLSVLKPGTYTAKPLPDAPMAKYAARVRDIVWYDADANLKLARDARDWGMQQESVTLYWRVLLMEPDNQEALDAMGFVFKDGKLTPKDNHGG